MISLSPVQSSALFLDVHIVLRSKVFNISLPVVPKDLWQIPSGEPHGQSTHQNPKDCKLIKHLTQETQGCMEVDRSNSYSQLQPKRKEKVTTEEQTTNSIHCLRQPFPNLSESPDHKISLKKETHTTYPRRPHPSLERGFQVEPKYQHIRTVITAWVSTLFSSTEPSWEQAVNKSQHCFTAKNSQPAQERKWKLHKNFTEQ